MSHAEEFVTALYDALREPLGIIVEVSDQQKALQKLYRARGQDEDFQALSFSPSKVHANQILIIRKPKEQMNGRS